MTPLLAARKLGAGYGQLEIVRDLELELRPGEVVALLGPNGAGKSTIMQTLAGTLPPLSGHVEFDGAPTTSPVHKRARSGLSFVTEERSVLGSLTAMQNLQIGRGCDIDKAQSIFPELRPLMSRRAGLLSGGEQQMLTLARALSRPTRVLLADELSLGLATKVVDRLLSAVREAADNGVGVLLVEQHVQRVLEIADRAVVMQHGRVVYEGDAANAADMIVEIQDLYFSQPKGGKTARGPARKKRNTRAAGKPAKR